MPPRAHLVRLAPAFLLPLLACGGRDAGFSPRPTTFPLPAGVYEVRVALEFEEGEPAWSLPLPDAVEARLVVREPIGDQQELTLFQADSFDWQPPTAAELAFGDQLVVEREPSGFPEHLRLGAVPLAGPCRRAISLEATDPAFTARDADGDGVPETIEGILAGTATEEVPMATDRTHEPTRPFRGRLVATPDRTPPAVVPAADPVSPWGPYFIRFSEPVLFDAVDFALETAGGPTPVQSNYLSLPTDSSEEQPVRWDPPLVGFRLEQDFDGLVSLAPGAPVRLRELRVRDLAGHSIDLAPADLGLRVVAPEGRAVESFEDGALAGWATTGGVRAVRGSAELPALDGEWLVAGSPLGFSLATRIEVPDTEAPALELAAEVRSGGPALDGVLRFEVGDGPVVLAYAQRLGGGGTSDVLRIDLAPLRGRTATVFVGVEPWECTPATDGTVVLDSFRVVP